MKYDLENEQLVVANVLQFPEFRSKFVAELSEKDFIVAKHKTFYSTIKYALENNLVIDNEIIVTLSKNFSYPIEVKDLMDLQKFYPDKVQNFDFHLEKLKNESFRFRFISDIEKIHECSSIEDIYKLLTSLKIKVSKNLASKNLILQSSEYLVTLYKDVFNSRLSGKDFFSTGYSSLDEDLTKGFFPGGVSVIAGRAGMGKSALISNMLYRLSLKNIPVAHFTLEMSSVSVLDRIISLSTFIPLKKLIKLSSELNSTEKETLSQKLEELSSNKFLYISDNPRMSLANIVSQVEKLKEKKGFEYLVVFVDLFGQITDIDPSMAAISYETSLREAKLYARELNVHFVLVAQINRRVEQQSRSLWKYRPNLDDLKHSGGWEEVADIVFLLFRAKYYNKELEDDILEINVAKQREGATFKKYFMMDPNLSLIIATDLKPYDERSLKI